MWAMLLCKKLGNYDQTTLHFKPFYIAHMRSKSWKIDKKS